MEFRRRSLWNRVWEGETLYGMGQEEYVRRIYEDEGNQDHWREIGYGFVLSVWKGVQWTWRGLGLNGLWDQEVKDEEAEEAEEHV